MSELLKGHTIKSITNTTVVVEGEKVQEHLVAESDTIEVYVCTGCNIKTFAVNCDGLGCYVCKAGSYKPKN